MVQTLNGAPTMPVSGLHPHCAVEIHMKTAGDSFHTGGSMHTG